MWVSLDGVCVEAREGEITRVRRFEPEWEKAFDRGISGEYRSFLRYQAAHQSVRIKVLRPSLVVGATDGEIGRIVTPIAPPDGGGLAVKAMNFEEWRRRR